ncbi:hypothetical protein JHK82_050657 [Glycine max]|uniref:Uncharacterized protein n=2 Tax=Glycine subgen. Soja TaxID=1462606 RepID=A0A0R0FCI9_SOYBN|nr:hypothetical protein JHK87_050352 [Glycine soja]KAG4936452.1 hypothetical protein JHK85_051371 [Glycine max]KAG5091879.1 hypothetical protein JHK82_050657 [Glycine max]KAG5094978.1 hypothetical protein JHK84_050566 [Glycine max]RZB52363.1 hypothetical protein D0Y65_048719 [Glycine soja]
MQNSILFQSFFSIGRSIESDPVLAAILIVWSISYYQRWSCKVVVIIILLSCDVHYGFFENLGGEFEPILEKGKEVSLFFYEPMRKLNSRIGLGNLEPGKAYHFPDGNLIRGLLKQRSNLHQSISCCHTPMSIPLKCTISQNEMQSKQKDLEPEANALISMGGKVFVDILPYDEAPKLCVVGFGITIIPVTLLSYKVPSSVCTKYFYFYFWVSDTCLVEVFEIIEKSDGCTFFIKNTLPFISSGNCNSPLLTM